MLRLIALDLDGTLLGGTAQPHSIMPVAVDTLTRASHAGAYVALVTGRSFPFVRDLVAQEFGSPEKLGWPNFIISVERELYAWDGAMWQGEKDWNALITERESAHYATITAGIQAMQEEKLSSLHPEMQIVSERPESWRGFASLVFPTADAARAAMPVLEQWLTEKQLPYAVMRNKRGVTVRHCDVGKGVILSRLAKQIGVNPSEVLAMGDSCNDLDMLDGRFGFNSATTANAEPEAKAAVAEAGGYIAQGEVGSGVAEAVSRWLEQEDKQSVG